MGQRFYSRKDLWLGMVLWGSAAVMVWAVLASGLSFTLAAAAVLYIGFISWIWFATVC